MATVTMPEYPWFYVVSGDELHQGDILLDCPILRLPRDLTATPGRREVLIERQNAIILTQSCDLVIRADGRCLAEDAILAPFYQKFELGSDSTYRRDDAWEEARKGRHQGYHVLNQCVIEHHELDFAIVDLRRAFSLSMDWVRQHAQSLGPRLRLLPPYREHLSQAFARFLMRVGLPTDIPPFGKPRK